MWDVMPGDFDQRVDDRELLENMITYTDSGSIIVLHDNPHAVEKLAKVISEYIEAMEKEGYIIDTLDKVFPKK